MITKKQNAKKLLIILAAAVIVMGAVGIIALFGTQSAYAFYGVSGRMSTTEHSYSVCTETGCANTVIHVHAGIVYSGHDVRDGHAYHSCGVADCAQIDSHSHNSCGVSGCYTTENHRHESVEHNSFGTDGVDNGHHESAGSSGTGNRGTANAVGDNEHHESVGNNATGHNNSGHDRGHH
ncbi:MAG: hypothetical protein LBK67_01945 [Coriobacteriales bacterium]|jgi:hypothetical protein|nr:hypothetical protein [Coriobacteriales bacterium]